jgi:hypothetical protein
VAQFSQAVIQNNIDWQAGDQLTFFFAEQWVDSEGVPRATLKAQRMVMSLTSQTKLWSLVSALGFSSVNGYLGMNTALSETGASWIHSRDRQGDTTQVSTQRLMVVSTLLAQYQGDEAMLATAKSYGGINTREMFLSPQSTMAELGMEVNENENQNGSGGSVNPTVAAPTISGSTPFEETTTVTMSGPAGATIYYTTDGSTPTDGSTAYTEALTLSATTTVKAIAVKDGVTSSITSRTFTKGSGGNDPSETE